MRRERTCRTSSFTDFSIDHSSDLRIQGAPRDDFDGFGEVSGVDLD